MLIPVPTGTKHRQPDGKQNLLECSTMEYTEKPVNLTGKMKKIRFFQETEQENGTSPL